MKLNTKVRYGLRALMELGMEKNRAGLLQKDIAMNQNISEKYLDPIVASLKAAGLIVNVGGKKSGYILKRQASEIRIIDVYRAFEPGPYIIHCICDPKTCVKTGNCTTNVYWTGLNNLITDYMAQTTLEMLIDQTRELAGRRKKKSKPLIKVKELKIKKKK